MVKQEALMQRAQDRFWPADGPGGATQFESHYGQRSYRCFSQRPPNLDAMLTDIVARFPEREAVVVEDRRVTYRELDDLVERAAAGLTALRLARGDRVALLLGNCLEFVVACLACNRLGLVCVPIGHRQRQPEVEFVLNDCGVAALIFETEFAINVPPPPAVPGLRHRFVVGDPVDGAAPFASLVAQHGPFPRHLIGEEETAFILYTSGTTGRPKGAMLTHLGVIHSVLTMARCLGLTHEDRSIVAVPISHVTGLVAIFLSVVCVGGCNVLMRAAYKTPAFLDLAARERMSYTVAVPAIYTLCANDPHLASRDLSAWRLGAFGGAPMPVATIEAVAQLLPGLILINAYGATETTSPTTLMPPGRNLEHIESVGQVVPCGEVIVVDEDGNALPPGAAGELWIRGPMVVPGYWNHPDANRANFTDGYWHSGDIGLIDAEGFVKVFDRAKDMINRAGYKVFSAEVENVLSSHPGVLECAIVGRPDPVLGERVHAFIVARDEVKLTADEIRAFCIERMADYKVPEGVELLPEPLPRNANGKIQKPILRERAKAAASPVRVT
jgi:acyl-CoA synthetase (AMP-forming)/AMP-acid ligase II